MLFEPFPKIPRLAREMVITEKLDGTNASLSITAATAVELAQLAEGWDYDRMGIVAMAEDRSMVMRAGSRNRWLTLGNDNYGFARWARENAALLFRLGEGHHFGEWWGNGIQCGYGLSEKRFSLFNVGRWFDPKDCDSEITAGRQAAPDCCHVVPTLLRGPFDTRVVDASLKMLAEHGSYAAPGFMDPEGVIVWHDAARQMFKKTIKHDQGKHA